jgi:hypothetical protein
MFMFISAPPEPWGSFRALVGNKAPGVCHAVDTGPFLLAAIETYGYTILLLEQGIYAEYLACRLLRMVEAVQNSRLPSQGARLILLPDVANASCHHHPSSFLGR